MHLVSFFDCSLSHNFFRLDAVMGTIWNTTAAMDAYKWFYDLIKIDGINRTCLRTCTATDAELLFYYNATSLSLGIGTSRTGGNAWSRVASQTGPGLEPG